MASEPIDPKVVIRKQKAEHELQQKVDANVINLKQVLAKHRGHCTMLLTNGEIITCEIKLSTGAITVVNMYDGHPFRRLLLEEIADITTQ